MYLKQEFIPYTRKLIIGAFCLFLSPMLWGQQAMQLSQYMHNQFAINPAMVGSSGELDMTAAVRGQWLGLEGRPFSQTFTAQMPVPLLKGGWGLSVSNDMLGAQRDTRVNLAYAYHLSLGAKQRLSFGAQAGIAQSGLRGDLLITPDGSYADGAIDHQDDALPFNTANAIAPLLAVGAHLQLQSLSIGLSAQQLMFSSLSFPSSSSDIAQQLSPQLNVALAYALSLSSSLALTPRLLAKSDLKQMQLDASVMLTIDQRWYAGVGFRGYNANTIDAIMAYVGAHLNEKTFLGYSYDIGLSGLNDHHAGSHELVFKYTIRNLLSVKSGKVRYNPRFL